MGLQSGIRPIVVVPGRGKQDGLARTVKLAIDGVEAVDHKLELRGKSEVVQRCTQDNKVAVDEMRIELEHVITIDARRRAQTAMVAPAAGCDAPEGGIESIDFGPDFLGAANEFVGQQKGSASTMRTAGDDRDFLWRRGGSHRQDTGGGNRSGGLKQFPAFDEANRMYEVGDVLC